MEAKLCWPPTAAGSQRQSQYRWQRQAVLMTVIGGAVLMAVIGRAVLMAVIGGAG